MTERKQRVSPVQDEVLTFLLNNKMCYRVRNLAFLLGKSRVSVGRALIKLHKKSLWGCINISGGGLLLNERC